MTAVLIVFFVFASLREVFAAIFHSQDRDLSSGEKIVFVAFNMFMLIASVVLLVLVITK